MTQTTIFDPPHNGTPTSIAAAESIQPRAGGLRARVLEFIVKAGGATIDEVSQGTGILTATVCRIGKQLFG